MKITSIFTKSRLCKKTQEKDSLDLKQQVTYINLVFELL